MNIARDDWETLAPLRRATGIEVGETDGLIWLRGNQNDGQLDPKLATLPALGRYEFIAPNKLRRINQRIPAMHLPEMRWHPLSTWLQTAMPMAAFPANKPHPLPLQLVRATEERDPQLLMAALPDVKNFADNAPRIRLERLHFAANAQGVVIMRGKPLPPISGRRFVLHGNIAVPVGFSWQPAVHANVLASSLSVSTETLLLWNEDGTITRLREEQFVPLTRSAIQATEQALAEPR